MTQPTVAVTGVAQRDIPPDEFGLELSVRRSAATSPEAYAALAAAYTDLEAVLAQWPVRVERGGISGHPEHHGKPGEVTGWAAYRSLHVTGRDFDGVADLAGAIGVLPDIGLSGPSWGVDDDNPAFDALQADAVHAARARAQRYAAALDGTLGELVELSDTDQHHHGPHRFSALSAGGPAEGGGLETLDLNPKDVRLTATVHARWYLDLPE